MVLIVSVNVLSLQDRISKGNYSTLDQFQEDVKLMFCNARVYNIEGSPVGSAFKLCPSVCLCCFITINPSGCCLYMSFHESSLSLSVLLCCDDFVVAWAVLLYCC